MVMDESEGLQVAQPGFIQGSTGKLSTLTWSSLQRWFQTSWILLLLHSIFFGV